MDEREIKNWCQCQPQIVNLAQNHRRSVGIPGPLGLSARMRGVLACKSKGSRRCFLSMTSDPAKKEGEFEPFPPVMIAMKMYWGSEEKIIPRIPARGRAAGKASPLMYSTICVPCNHSSRETGVCMWVILSNCALHTLASKLRC